MADNGQSLTGTTYRFRCAGECRPTGCARQRNLRFREERRSRRDRRSPGKRHARYALFDLDYFAWGFAGNEDDGAEHQMMLRNLGAVVANFRAAGVRFFVLARFIRDAAELESLRAELGMPLRVVYLDVPLVEIQRRLTSDPTTGRRDDLREAAASFAARDGVGLEDIVVSNNRDVFAVASGNP